MNLIFAWLISKLSAAQPHVSAEAIAIPCPVDRSLQPPDRHF
jgi:hypothetical protein